MTQIPELVDVLAWPTCNVKVFFLKEINKLKLMLVWFTYIVKMINQKENRYMYIVHVQFLELNSPTNQCLFTNLHTSLHVLYSVQVSFKKLEQKDIASAMMKI